MSYTDDFPYSDITEELLNKMPSWMRMRMYRNESSINDTLAAQFLNVFGLEFESAQENLDEFKESLDQFNISQIVGETNSGIDYVYRVDIEDVITGDLANLKVFIDGVEIEVVTGLESFFRSDDQCCIIDGTDKLCYIRRGSSEPETLTIDAYRFDGSTEQFTFNDFLVHHVWNELDEIGLMLGLPRLFKEDNRSYKLRLINVFLLPRGANAEGLINGIAGLTGINPKDISLYDLSDLAFKGTLLNDDGTPNGKLKHYAKVVNDKIANTWGNMNWDQAYWISLSDTSIGIDYLPHVWDVPTKYCISCGEKLNLENTTCTACGSTNIGGWQEKDFQSGIGSFYDLLVKLPEVINGEQEFTYTLRPFATVNEDVDKYIEHKFDYKIYAKGSAATPEPKLEHVKYSVLAAEEFTLDNNVSIVASETYITDIDSVLWDLTSAVNVEQIAGNSIMSPDYPFIKVVNSFEGTAAASPHLDSLSIVWEDNNGVTQTTTIDSASEFAGGDVTDPYPRVYVERTNTSITDEHVQMSYKGFQVKVNTDQQWLKGTTADSCIIKDGKLTLN